MTPSSPRRGPSRNPLHPVRQFTGRSPSNLLTVLRASTQWAPSVAALFCIAVLMTFTKVIAQPTGIPPAAALLGPTNRVASTPAVYVREFRFHGNRVFSSGELAAVLRTFTHRVIDSTDLEDARLALASHYVNHGYHTSGAVLDDQTVEDGVITFRVVEGRLAQITITGHRHLRTAPLRNQIARDAGNPLHLPRLQDALWLLKQNPNVKTLNAELQPRAVLGESRLNVFLTEENPWRLHFQARNDRPPSVGAEIVELVALHQNVTGRSDPLSLRYGIAEGSGSRLNWTGVNNLGAGYSLPLTASDGGPFAAYDRSDYAVIEEPFDQLDISSRSDAYRIGWRQPFVQTPVREFALTLAGERRSSHSFLGDAPFSFSPGAVDGESTSTALRFVQEWSDRSLSQLLALRSTFSWGIDALGATDDGSHRDGQFISWLAQARHVRRLGQSANQLLVGTTLQWTDSPLLTVEQFTLGGIHTVRGYRENTFVRDMAATASLEFHLPVLFNQSGGAVLELAPFADFGLGWNFAQSDPEQLLSIGAGLLFNFRERISAQLFWGHPFINPNQAKRRDLQDYGLHFKLAIRAW